ncbi:hypothetical protein JOF53_007405 [Crossiella equi]|uniref:Uncharacterized protein n=1 Tax=Crossiella equi TaxID=130796 RepID=A0ABS5APP3_9PSEU|nr:hypothetical protein [Crossiella equi]MBP2478533.1 hypothetical protein [Crossiella equi]
MDPRQELGVPLEAPGLEAILDMPERRIPEFSGPYSALPAQLRPVTG